MLPVAIASMDELGDKDYLTNLYIKHYSLMMYLAFQIMKNKSEAEEVLQSAAVKLVEKVRVLRTLNEPQAVCYLSKTVKSIALHQIQRRKRQLPSDWLDEQPDDHDGPELAYIRMESYDELGQAIATLGQRDQDLLYFKYYLDMPNIEICAALGISEASIRPLLYRARKRALHAMEGRAGR